MSATALHKALLDAGADDELAERTAKDLPPIGEPAAKTDISELKTDIARLETWLLRWDIILAGIIIAAIGLIVKL